MSICTPACFPVCKKLWRTQEWKCIRSQVLTRDTSTCVYCGWKAWRFQQVNQIGAEDDHRLDNLETVCQACYAVLHIGIRSMKGQIRAFDCKEDVTTRARIVHATRMLVSGNLRWPQIEQQILDHDALPGGRVYTCDETTVLANQMLRTIPSGEYRGDLESGKAILFHASPPWNGFSERVHMWQLSG